MEKGAVGYLATWQMSNSNSSTMQNLSFQLEEAGVLPYLLQSKWLLNLRWPLSPIIRCYTWKILTLLPPPPPFAFPWWSGCRESPRATPDLLLLSAAGTSCARSLAQAGTLVAACRFLLSSLAPLTPSSPLLPVSWLEEGIYMLPQLLSAVWVGSDSAPHPPICLG